MTEVKEFLYFGHSGVPRKGGSPPPSTRKGNSSCLGVNLGITRHNRPFPVPQDRIGSTPDPDPRGRLKLILAYIEPGRDLYFGSPTRITTQNMVKLQPSYQNSDHLWAVLVRHFL